MEQFNNLRGRHGFTLIELLVTVAISGVLVGLGVASYNSFNQRQTLNLAVRGLKTNLWATEVKAVANKQRVPPLTCPNFAGYKVTLDESSYTIVGQCNEEEFDSESFSLPSNVRKKDPANQQIIIFKPRTGGTNLSLDLVLTYEFISSNTTETVTITTTGEIK